MTRTIGDLPMEIMDLIVDLISSKDILTCLYVNHEWHTLFERILYKSFDTRDRAMFLFFLKRLTTTLNQQQQQQQQEQQHSSFPLGHYVRELKICDGFMTEKQMTDLKRACPNITSLTFRWQDSKAHEEHVYSSIDTLLNDNSPTKKNQRYFGIPKKIMEMFPCVTQLTLECEAKWRRTRPRLLHDFIRNYLFATHHVQFLTLNNVSRNLCYRQLDLIHEACPNLIQLEIFVSSTSDYDSYLEKPTRLRHLDGPEWPRQKLLRIQHITLSDHTTHSTTTLEKCIRYFAARYPDLRSISFNNRGRESSWGSSIDFISPVPWQYVPPLSSSSLSATTASSSSSIQETYNNNNDDDKVQRQQQDDDNTMGLLAKRCPKLHSIELLNVTLPSNAIKHLFSGQQLENVSFKGRYRAMNHQGFYEMLRLLYPKVVQLSLSIPTPLISLFNNLTTTTTDEALILSNFNENQSNNYAIGFKNLVQLELIQQSSGPIQIHLNHILEICPVLQSLTLVHTDVTANKETEEDDDLTYPSLKTIKLRNVHISSISFMKFISNHCPQLLHFHMLRCTGPFQQQRQQQCRLGYTDGSQFIIDFPHHQLKSLVIFQHVVIQPYRINLVALDLSNKNKKQEEDQSNFDISHHSSSSTTPTPTPTKTREPLYYYDHWYWIPEDVIFTFFIQKASKNFYKNYKELNFDDSDMIYPSFTTSSYYTRSKQAERISIKKLTMDQGNELMNYIQPESPTLSRKRKRNHVEIMKQQHRAKLYPTSDRIMNECRKEIDSGGYFPIRCQSISKLVFNGTFLIHNGICLPSTSFISNE
ncbi:hypothetical protein BDC45DRAFT_568249 [Circinella umbellata]|nr:hypothetical protein BDC45DRAFT_568249 [Circinella umbellata]